MANLSGKPRPKKLPKFRKKKFSDGTSKVEVIGAVGVVWWRLNPPFPDRLRAGKDWYVLEWHEEIIETEFGNEIEQVPRYVKEEND